MAGPLAERFSQDISWIISHNIVQLAQPRPWFIVLYIYRTDREPIATPFALISRNEYRQPHDVFMVRVWDADEGTWDYLPPMFNRRDQVAEYLARYHSPEPNHHIGIGTSTVFTAWPIVEPVPLNRLRHNSTATQWLLESRLFEEFALDYNNPLEASRDRRGMQIYVEDQDMWDVLFEEQITLLISLMI
jgi:hypothetical protein